VLCYCEQSRSSRRAVQAQYRVQPTALSSFFFRRVNILFRVKYFCPPFTPLRLCLRLSYFIYKQERENLHRGYIYNLFSPFFVCVVLCSLFSPSSASFALSPLAVCVCRFLARVTNECLVSAPNPIQYCLRIVVLLLHLLSCVSFCFTIFQDCPVGREQPPPLEQQQHSFLPSFLPLRLFALTFSFFLCDGRERDLPSSPQAPGKNGVFVSHSIK
jgi:hypothetical protein